MKTITNQELIKRAMNAHDDKQALQILQEIKESRYYSNDSFILL